MLLLGDTPPSNGPSISVVSDNLTDGGAVVPGVWFYVKGADLADVTRLWAGSDFADPSTLPTDLNGVEVWVDGTPVPVCFISPGQVNAQAPANMSGTIEVQVVRLGIPSNVLTAPVSHPTQRLLLPGRLENLSSGAVCGLHDCGRSRRGTGNLEG